MSRLRAVHLLYIGLQMVMVKLLTISNILMMMLRTDTRLYIRLQITDVDHDNFQDSDYNAKNRHLLEHRETALDLSSLLSCEVVPVDPVWVRLRTGRLRMDFFCSSYFEQIVCSFESDIIFMVCHLKVKPLLVSPPAIVTISSAADLSGGVLLGSELHLRGGDRRYHCFRQNHHDFHCNHNQDC